MNKKQLVSECLRAAVAFLQQRPWLRLGNEDLLVFELPGQDYALAASVMGAATEEFGLMAFVGPNAIPAMLRLCEGDMELTATSISMSLEERANLSGTHLRQLEEAGCRGRTVPVLVAKEVGKQPRPLNRTELDAMTRMLRVVSELARRDGLSSIAGTPPNLLPVLRVHGSVQRSRFELSSRPISAADRADSLDLPPQWEEWEVGSHHLLVGLEFGGRSAADGDRPVFFLLVVDVESGLVHATAVLGCSLSAVAAGLYEVFRGETALPGQLPRQITFTHPGSFRGFEGPFVERGVECILAESVPQVDELYADLARHVDSDSSEQLPLRWPKGIPADDDLAAWKALDREAVDVSVEPLEFRDGERDRLWTKYFGVPRTATRLDPPDYADMKGVAFIDWCVHHHRRGRNGRTALERSMARSDIHPGVRRILRARAASVAAVYRVTGVEPGTGIDVQDVASGRQLTVHDRGISMTAEVGLGLVLRVYPVGGFHFAVLAGPAIPQMHLSRALNHLQEDLGLDLLGTDRDRPHRLFGRLWSWVESAMDLSSLELRNSDGEAILWHSGSFLVAEVTALAAALEREPGFDAHPESTEEWVWFEERDGSSLHLGRLSIVGDRLLLEVNSGERFARGRAILEALPGGVRFESVTKKSIDPRDDKGAPLDHRLPEVPEPIPDDVLARVQDMMQRKYMQWLDEPIPMLGGKSPREACETEAGRQKVKQLIRTYPDPGGGLPVRVPREEMLDELGLEAEG